MKRNLPYIEVLCIIYLAFLALTTSYRCIELDKSNRHLSKLVIKLSKENERLRVKRAKEINTFQVPSDWKKAPIYKEIQ